MHTLDETSCAKGKPLRTLWTADEARLVKRILNNLTVKQWNLPSTEVERDLSGDWTIWIPEGGSGGGTSTYRSYFRVIDASTETDCKIGVTSGAGAVGEDGVCGTVKINAARVDVNEFTGAAITAAGTYYVWLHSWIGGSGPEAEIIIGNATRPANPNSGIAFGSQLLGRVVIDAEGNLTITQDYLRGGEHTEILIGDCEGGAIA